MSFSIYSRDRKSLQFPVMCEGYVQIKSADALASSTTGIWDYNGPFTMEALITPYDVNGNPITSEANLGSQKTLPQGTKGLAYLSAANRHNMEMCIFHNARMTVSLVNKTTTAFYQPAEYSIKFSLTIGTTTTTLERPVVFGTEIMDKSHTNPTSFIYREHLPLYQSSGSTVHSSYSGGTSIPTTGTFYVGQKIYKNDGTLIGEISAFSTGSPNTITVSSITNTPAASSTIYLPVNRDALYPETSHHIAVSYGYGRMFIIYNNRVVAEGAHTGGNQFQLEASDIYLGQNPNAGTPRLTQFMGELHELSYTKGQSVNFKSINSLTPGYKNALLYIDFEESRLDG